MSSGPGDLYRGALILLIFIEIVVDYSMLIVYHVHQCNMKNDEAIKLHWPEESLQF